jgi:hypothetical protein
LMHALFCYFECSGDLNQRHASFAHDTDHLIPPDGLRIFVRGEVFGGR